MAKQEAINTVNDYLRAGTLNNQNTHFSNINNAKEVWWFDIPLAKFDNDLYLLLNKVNGFIWLKITANLFENLSDVFRIKQGQWIDFEISSNRLNNYMIDVKSGGTNYNFNQHVIKEFN